MKHHGMIILTGLFLMLTSSTAWAVDPYFYAGAKYGVSYFDVSGFDNGAVYSGFLGYI